ncbi:hypothetical protein [Burkholderia oklahomensis]|nr:hypothetical protein [Burkholderia oklahomensis]
MPKGKGSASVGMLPSLMIGPLSSAPCRIVAIRGMDLRLTEEVRVIQR